MPTNLKQLRRFIGLAGWKNRFNHRFIPQFSKRAVPLYALKRKNATWEWTAACQVVVDDLKTALTTTPVLQSPNFQIPFRVQTQVRSESVWCWDRMTMTENTSSLEWESGGEGTLRAVASPSPSTMQHWGGSLTNPVQHHDSLDGESACRALISMSSIEKGRAMRCTVPLSSPQCHHRCILEYTGWLGWTAWAATTLAASTSTVTSRSYQIYSKKQLFVQDTT